MQLSVFLLCFASLALSSPLLNTSKNPAGYDAASTTNVSGAKCNRQSYTIEVNPDISVFSDHVTSTANQTVLTARLLSFVTSLPTLDNFTETYLSGGATRPLGNKSFNISGVLCEPESGASNSSAISLLVHGIGFDSSYWNFGGTGGVQQDYSYAYQAAKKGLRTFRYDRLGTGLSDHPEDAYNVVQAATDLAILTKVAAGLRDGSLTGKSYSTIVGVGHSYGSVQCQALTAQNPKALDHVVLTGYSANTSNVALYETSTAYTTAYNVFPDRFSSRQLPAAYLTTLAPQTNLLNFFYWPHYTNEAATLARQTEQPVTQGVLFTFGTLGSTAKEFAGKVHVVTGAQDYIFCLSNCHAVPPGSSQSSMLDFVADLYPQNGGFSTYIPANTGHGISAHRSAAETYTEINNWIAQNL